MAQRDAGGMLYWTDVEECYVYGGGVVLPRTGSNEPVPGVIPCWTGVEGCDVYEGDIVLPRTGSDEPATGVTPCWTGVERCDVYEGDIYSPAPDHQCSALPDRCGGMCHVWG